ncbi:MAG TPA: gliding-motility protein MglA [Acidobacteriota bacterium]|nr:gliding-motility protein MglA [Acidobacteriota bacterium]
MPYINYARREINYKIVYCGPGLSGKTTNITQIYRSVKPRARGRLVSLYTEMERTLYFDFLPLNLGEVRGFKVRVHLYSVPGQICYAAPRQLVFRGADGMVFVADSTRIRMDANLEALRDLKENLQYYSLDVRNFPYALQLNKRDLSDIHEADYLVRELRLAKEPIFEAVANQNDGVRETLKDVIRQILVNLEHEVSA